MTNLWDDAAKRGISNVLGLSVSPGQYIVASIGPCGGDSTWPECFGAGAQFSARAAAVTDTIEEATQMAAKYGTRTLIDGARDIVPADIYIVTDAGKIKRLHAGRPPRSKADPLRRRTYRVQDSIHARIAALAEERGCSQGDVVAEAIRLAGN